MWARIFMAHISTFFGIMFGACTILHIWIDFMHWKKNRVVNYIHLWIVKLFKMRFWCTWNMMKRLRALQRKRKKKNTQTHTNTLGLCVDGIMGTMLNFFVLGALSVVSFGIDSYGHSSCIHISIVDFQFHLIHMN